MVATSAKSVQRVSLSWVLISVVALISVLAASSLQLAVNDLVLIQVRAFAFAAGLYGLGRLLVWIGDRRSSVVLTSGGRFFCSAGKLGIFLVFAGLAQYEVGATNFPLVDDLLLRADSALGFDWEAWSGWLAHNHLWREALFFAYSSPLWQMLLLGTAHCTRTGNDRNEELICCFMVSLIIVYICAIFFPALGRPGLIGQHHIDVLVAARSGKVTDFDGIITFPSFHSALGALLIYSARPIKSVFVGALLLNLLLIAATPPVGGHYVVDTLAGVLVAVMTIGIVNARSRFGCGPLTDGVLSRSEVFRRDWRSRPLQ